MQFDVLLHYSLKVDDHCLGLLGQLQGEIGLQLRKLNEIIFRLLVLLTQLKLDGSLDHVAGALELGLLFVFLTKQVVTL